MSEQQYLEELSRGFTRLMHYLHHLAGQVSKIGDFSLAQYRILMLLDHYQPLTVSELKEHLGNAQSSVSEILLRMEEQGLVVRKPNPKDRRQTLLKLSPKARRMIAERKGKMVEVYRELVKGKNVDEIKELVHHLNRLLMLLEKDKPKVKKGFL